MSEYKVDPNEKFNKAVNDAIKELGDLTTPFRLMTREWFKGNRSIFDEGRQGPGKYQDLTTRYKKAKTRAIGSPYPILRGFVRPKGQAARKSGKLAKSMIDPTDGASIVSIINKTTLVLGTRVVSKKGSPYGIFINEGTKNMAARPFMLIGGEQVATKEINKRRENWVNMIEDYMFQISKGYAE